MEQDWPAKRTQFFHQGQKRRLFYCESCAEGERVRAGTIPFGLVLDGIYVWVANSTTHNVTRLRASDGATPGTFPAGESPTAVAFEGANIWVVNGGSNTVSKL